MHTGNGDLYRLDPEAALGEEIKLGDVLKEHQIALEDRARAVEAQKINTAPIVAVDAEVVQKLRLGERELRRRRQRRS